MSLLYSISRPNSDSTSYIFGTIHLPIRVIELDMFFVQKLIESCDAFGLEVSDDHESKMIQQKHIMLPAGITLDSLIPKKRWDKYRSIFMKSFGLDLDQFSQYRPMIIYLIVFENIVNDGSERILDIELLRYAEGLNKRITSLEDPEEHFALLDKISIDQQLKMLKKVASSPEKVRAELAKSIQYYNHRDSVKIYKQGKRSTGKNRRIMLYERNQKMAESIYHTILSGKSVFATFGAAHLEGKFGIKAHLIRKGFAIKPVKM